MTWETNENLLETNESIEEPEILEETDVGLAGEDGASETSQQEEEEQSPQDDVQAVVDRVVNRKFAQWKRRQERELKKIFGTSDLNAIQEAYRAGVSVAQAAGITPRDVLTKLETMTPQQGVDGNMTAPNNLVQEIQEIKKLVMSQQVQRVMSEQEAEARKEFGNLYDEYRDEIHELAGDRDLSLVDAAAVVLRPHLPKLYQQRLQAQSQNLRRKRVEGSEGAPAASHQDYVAKLTKEQIIIAQKMGLSPKEYAQQLKELGRLD